MLVAASCSSGGESKPANTSAGLTDVKEATPPSAVEPVTLSMYQGTGITDDEFTRFIADPVKKVYLNITVKLVHPDKNTTPEQLVSANQFPDLIFAGFQSMSQYMDLKLPYDLTDLVKKNKLDTDKFDSVSIKRIGSFSGQGKLFALPFSDKFSLLFYNKDLYDKFAVPYPKDGLTWDDVIALGTRLSRMDGGTKYKGLYAGDIRNFGAQLSLSYTDAKTGKAAFSTDGWKNVLELYRSVQNIPGNQLEGKFMDEFLKNQDLAMVAATTARIADIEQYVNGGQSFNWDLVSYPNFKGKLGIGLDANPQIVMISSTSQHKDEAFKVLQVVTDAEDQLLMNGEGRLTVLKDPAIKQKFGSNYKSLKGKNIQGIFKNSFAASPAVLTPYESIALKYLGEAADKVASGATDANTALSDAEEKFNLDVSAMAAK
jgi:multiple sugar transport system substrate-binding protein